MSSSLEAKIAIDALQMAIDRREVTRGLIHHSDRGVQYASRAFRAVLEVNDIAASMSRKGNCYDNATVESFWASLKTELHLSKPFNSKEEARLAIFDYIEIFYNRQRLHSSIGYQSPLDYESKLMAQSTRPFVSAISG